MTMGPTQPPHADSPRVPITGDAPVDLTWEDVQFLFTVTLDSIKAWDEADYPDYLDHERARRHLHDLARALVSVSEAQLKQMAPQTAAQREARQVPPCGAT